MLHKNVKLLTGFNFFTDFRLYAPIAIIYFSQISGSFALGMSIFSLVMVSSAFFEIPTGVLSDRVGRRKTLILGALAALAYSIFYAVGQFFWVLVIGAVFEGLSRAFYSGNNEALLHDTLAETHEEHQYEEFLGKTSAMFQAALAISAILGAFLATWSFPLIMWLSVIPQFICVCISLFVKEPKVQKELSGNIFIHLKEAFQNFTTNRKLRLLSLSSILSFGFGEAGYQFQSAFYNTLWPVWAIGVAKALSNIGAALSFHFSGKIIRKFGYLNIMIFSNLYNRVTKIIAVLFPTPVSPLLFSSTSVFFGVESVALGSLMNKEATNAQRATMGSLDSFAGSIFFGVVAVGMGFLADKFSPAHAFLILQLFQFSNLIIFWKLFHHDKQVSPV